VDECPYLVGAIAYFADCKRRGLRPATMRYYRMVLGRLHSVAEVHELETLTVERVRTFQDRSASLSPGSMRGFLRALKTFSSWLETENLIPTDGLARLQLPRADRRVTVLPTDAELVTLLRYCSPTLRIIVVFLAATGVRISDATLINVDDVRPSVLVLSTTKNRGGRVIPIDGALDAILELQVNELRRGREGPLFVSRNGRRLSADSVRRAMGRTLQDVRLGVRITPHVLRHWHASDLAVHGTSERMITARMGWAMSDLLGRYAPVTQAEIERDVDRYSPLVRLRDQGMLDGLFPRRALDGRALQRSKKVADGTGPDWGRRRPERQA
jgi:site-specific recombinase XerD